MKAILKPNERMVVKMSKNDAKILRGFLCCVNEKEIEYIAKEHEDEKLNAGGINDVIEDLWNVLDYVLGRDK
jgi:hypothetical protein